MITRRADNHFVHVHGLFFNENIGCDCNNEQTKHNVAKIFVQLATTPTFRGSLLIGNVVFSDFIKRSRRVLLVEGDIFTIVNDVGCHFS